MDRPAAEAVRRKTGGGGVGAGAGRVDLCADEYGFHRDLSGESPIVGKISEGALSQRSQERSHRCGTTAGNGATQCGPFSSLGAWRRADAQLAATDRGPA